jgi:pentatricopeptide repeat protein
MYTNCGEPKRAISLWEELTDSGTIVTANEFIRTSIFTATYRLAVVPTSVKHLLELTHGDIERGFINNEALENAMLNVYAKCGDIGKTKLLFDRICTQRGTPSINSWNSIINAYAKHRNGRKACEHFECLLGSHVKPDSVTFVVLLNACAHSGLVKECQQYYHLMQSKFSILSVRKSSRSLTLTNFIYHTIYRAPVLRN